MDPAADASTSKWSSTQRPTHTARVRPEPTARFVHWFVGQELVGTTCASRSKRPGAVNRSTPSCCAVRRTRKTLAHLIAQGMDADIVVTSGRPSARRRTSPAPSRVSSATRCCSSTNPPPPQAAGEVLYSAMEDRHRRRARPGTQRTQRPARRPAVHAVGATTREGSNRGVPLSPRHRRAPRAVSGCGHPANPDASSSAPRVTIEDDAAAMCAERGRCPRAAAHPPRVRDLAQVLDKPAIDARTAEEGYRASASTASASKGSTATLRVIAGAPSDSNARGHDRRSEDTLEDVLEHLIRQGLLARTPRGRRHARPTSTSASSRRRPAATPAPTRSPSPERVRLPLRTPRHKGKLAGHHPPAWVVRDACFAPVGTYATLKGLRRSRSSHRHRLTWPATSTSAGPGDRRLGGLHDYMRGRPSPTPATPGLLLSPR